MSDLIERLRDFQVSAPTLPSCKACGDAADEIERLQDALRLIYTWNASGDYQRDLFRMKDFSIAALKGEK